MSGTPLQPLYNTALDTVVSLFHSQLTVPLDDDNVSYSLDPTAGTLTITSLDVTATGKVGEYINAATFDYGKADLSAILPYPVVYDGAWPSTYRLLVNYLKNRFGFVLEENEFTIPGNSVATALMFDDVIDAPSDGTNGEITLVAAASSGRWIAGSKIRIVMVPSNGKVLLPALIDGYSTKRASLKQLVDSTMFVDAIALSIYAKLVGWWDWSVEDPAYSPLQPYQLIDRTGKWPYYAGLWPAADGGQNAGRIDTNGVGGSEFIGRFTPTVNGYNGGFSYTTVSQVVSPGKASLDIDAVCGDQLAMVTWIKTSLPQSAAILGRIGLYTYYADTTDRLHLALSGTGLNFQYPLINGGVTTAETLACTANTNFADNQWHYIAAQIDAESAEIYTDGAINGSQLNGSAGTLRPTLSTNGDKGSLIWSKDPGAGDRTFDGAVSTTMLFSAKLTANEHAWLYNGGAGRSYDDLMAAIGL